MLSFAAGKTMLELNAQDVAVARIMQRDPKTTLATQSLRSAAAKMNVSGIRHLVVVNPEGNVCGLISQRDIYRFLAEHGNRTMSVQKAMTTPIITGDPEMSISEVAQTMRQEKIGCLPILSTDKQLIGIVTRSDLLDFIGA